MTSQGQRFRRRALRRGYKVDEVDAFLDRVEATLAGDQAGAAVSAQEVHDVVFRVRFGGYDEWQVDLHLDRVERQLAELEEQGGPEPGRARAQRPPIERSAGERTPVGRAAPERDAGERMPGDRLPGDPLPGERGTSERSGVGPRPTSSAGRPSYDDERAPRPGMREPEPAGFGRDEPGLGRGPEPREEFGYGLDESTFPGRGAARHGKADMTTEMRMPEREPDFPGRGTSAPTSFGPPAGAAAGRPSGAPAGGLPPEAQRVEALRQGFQVRRFGSGYDPAEVDGLFDGILNALAGRGPLPVPPAEVERAKFGLVPGGYFEAEVDAALREVGEMLRRY
ncbi:DivIVA domain-containing protein [Pilimelia columellifera]|uniref:Cell wall synthesis protein Wag31 n=1 Tax=Pilimelia columellifera subsp. columellifera TaxID=706583 RepID=A0ABN3N3U0_9ACTN